VVLKTVLLAVADRLGLLLAQLESDMLVLADGVER
jgi:hypothetical protein